MRNQFGELIASEIYCPKCKVAQPVRERLLLVLLDGELHEYVCVRCGASLGKRKVTGTHGKPGPMNPA
ncbi:MAG: hypothetical protein NZ739_08240 [Verrucomicrobiae bacterium]|nr:hypothetical protein [Verrucomicrobiae bacterium]MCX7721981.1 hypothetical protein [Verrucomicrobiae bacterium]